MHDRPIPYVINTCAILPVTVAITTLIGCSFLSKSPRPMYSPERAGVKLLIAIPPKIVKNALILVSLISDRINSLNFCASAFQFTSASMRTKEKINGFLLN